MKVAVKREFRWSSTLACGDAGWEEEKKEGQVRQMKWCTSSVRSGRDASAATSFSSCSGRRLCRSRVVYSASRTVSPKLLDSGASDATT